MLLKAAMRLAITNRAVAPAVILLTFLRRSLRSEGLFLSVCDQVSPIARQAIVTDSDVSQKWAVNIRLALFLREKSVGMNLFTPTLFHSCSGVPTSAP